MGLLDEAIREHLELKRKHGADEAEIARQEAEVFGAEPEQAESDPYALDAIAEGGLEAPPDRAAEAGVTGEREEPEFEWSGFDRGDLEVPGYVTRGEEGADDETRADGGGAETRLDEERPREVTDAPTELFQPLGADRAEEPEDELEEPAAPTVGEEAAGEEPAPESASADETALYEAPPIVEEEPAAGEPAADEPLLEETIVEEPAAEEVLEEEQAAEEPLEEEPAASAPPAEDHAADELSEGVPVDEAFVAEPSPAGAETVTPEEEEPELGREAPEDAPEAFEEEPLEGPPEAVEEEALAVGEPIEEAEPPRDEEMEAPPAAETVVDVAAPEEELEAEEQLEHEPAAEDEALGRSSAGNDPALEEEVPEDDDLSDLSASLEPSPFARPGESAHAVDSEPPEQPGEDPAEAELVATAPDEEAWDEIVIHEEGEPGAASATEDTAYVPPEERPLYEPVPDAEARPEEPLDIPPPATEVEPHPEPEPLAAELDVTEPDLDSEEGGEEADPSPPRPFFEDTAEYEGIPPERRPPRDPDFES